MEGKNLNPEVNNYAVQAESARVEFLKYDQSRMMKHFGLQHDDRFLYISFFHKTFGINRLTGEVLNCEINTPAGFNVVMSIYDIFCYGKAGASLSGEWQTITNLSPHSNFGSSGKSMFSATAKSFSGMVAELKSICTELGGHEATKADVGFLFDAFPCLPVIFQYWEGDDEFEPRINFLFDSNTLDYIHFETAWYVAGHLLDLISAGIANQDEGDAF